MVRPIPQGGNWKDIPLDVPSKRLEQIRKTGGRTTLYGRLSWDKPSFTITTYFNRPGNGTYIHPSQDRVISAREAARLQTFPDNFKFLGSKGSYCVQIGNAVPPLLGFSFASAIKKVVDAKNVLDLFSGAGGLSKGFEWAGYNIVCANDNYKPACETFRLNHPQSHFIEGDITSKEIKQEICDYSRQKGVDIVVGGPPCQGFSHAGKRSLDDPRNRLFLEFVAIVKKLSPKVVLVENVEGIMTYNNGKTYQEIKESFEKLGYNVHGQKMHAVRFGVPQKRKRVIIIGIKKNDPKECFPKDLLSEDQYVTVNDAISNLPPIKENGGGSDEIKLSLKPESLLQQLLDGSISPQKFQISVSKRENS